MRCIAFTNQAKSNVIIGMPDLNFMFKILSELLVQSTFRIRIEGLQIVSLS